MPLPFRVLFAFEDGKVLSFLSPLTLFPPLGEIVQSLVLQLASLSCTKTVVDTIIRPISMIMVERRATTPYDSNKIFWENA